MSKISRQVATDRGSVQGALPLTYAEVACDGTGPSPRRGSGPGQRNQSLDVLRCIAVLSVLGSHVNHYTLWSRVGWIGVDLFFVLSGFLVSGLLFQEYLASGEIKYRRFILRRGLKIWPAFYVYIAVSAGLVALIQVRRSAAFPWREFLTAALFLRNYFPGDSPFFAHIWSLAVEEHFYLLLPLVVFLLAVWRCRSRKSFDLIPLIFVLTATTCLALRVFTHRDNPNEWETHVRIDSLFAGVTLGYLYYFKRQWFQKMTGHHALAIALFGCLPAALLDEQSFVIHTFGLTSLFVGFSFLVAWSVVRKPKTRPGSFLATCAAKIGFYSYSIYLWHRLLAFIFSPNSASALAFWIYVAMAVLLGVGMAKLVEIPVLRMRETWRMTA